MSQVTAAIRLRPTRIGFLVRPTDMPSVRKIMRACTCVWGGAYNPIIPVYRTPPKEWKPGHFERTKGLAIARGYINFFEPDVFVEAEEGLIEDAGLGALREQHVFHPQICTLAEFLTPRDHRDWSEPAFGLNVMDAIGELYRTEQRFQAREKNPSVLIKPQRSSGLVESIFGAYPAQKDVAYLRNGYRDVFAPEQLEASPASWRKVFRDGAITPLRLTAHATGTQRFWYHDLIVYVFDPTRPTDLIDLWNMRIEPRPVVPIPIAWFEALADDVRRLLKAEFRPVKGNPSGVMHHGTVEFARSIGKAKVEELIKLTLHEDLPPEARGIKHWRNRIWVPQTDDRVHRDERMEITCEEKSVTLTLKEDGGISGSFTALSPPFASRYGDHDHRWVNAVIVRAYGSKKIATVLPFNMFDRRWPGLGMGGDRVLIGSEGWIFTQRYKNSSQYLSLMTPEEAIAGSLKSLGVKAALSEPGQIAKQMLEHLGGLWGVHLLADVETLQLLNKMAGGLRRKASETETVEETFERRSAPLKDWNDLIARRKQRHLLPALELKDFTDRNVIRLGLETECLHCQATNWHSLATVDYDVRCERCLKTYRFPQANVREQNRNWHYRVVGPFSVPDFGRGSYSALLTLRVLSRFRTSGEMTFSTAMNLSFDGVMAEADFVIWQREEKHGGHNRPQLVIGETKSLGKGDLIKAKDITKLKAIGRKLPGAVLVISVLRDEFTPTEKKLLRSFVKWCRRSDDYGRATNPVLLLTAHELFMEDHVSEAWKSLGGAHAKFSDYQHTRNLESFSDATQMIYLELPSLGATRRAEWEKRSARRRKKAEGKTQSQGLEGAPPGRAKGESPNGSKKEGASGSNERD